MSSSNNNAQSAMKRYDELQSQYTGNEGYQNSLEQARSGAAQTAGASINKAIQARRASGQSAAAAGAEASEDVFNNYAQNLQGQQSAAYGAGTDAVNTQGSRLGFAQAEDQNQYNRFWGNMQGGAQTIGSTAGTIAAIMSDERMKNYTECTDKFFCKKPKKDVALLKVTVKGDK